MPSGWSPSVVKSLHCLKILYSPREEFEELKFVAGSDSSAAVTVCDGGVLNVVEKAKTFN
jgi:hypothetical protein